MSYNSVFKFNIVKSYLETFISYSYLFKIISVNPSELIHLYLKNEIIIKIYLKKIEDNIFNI